MYLSIRYNKAKRSFILAIIRLTKEKGQFLNGFIHTFVNSTGPQTTRLSLNYAKLCSCLVTGKSNRCCNHSFVLAARRR